MQLNVTQTLKELVNDQSSQELAGKLPECFDLNNETLKTTKSVFSQMEEQLDSIPVKVEADKFLVKSLAGAVLTLGYFKLANDQFLDHLEIQARENLSLTLAAAATGLAIGFRYSISGFLKTLATRSELFFNGIRAMRDKSADTTIGSSVIRSIFSNSTLFSTQQFEKFYKIVLCASEATVIAGFTYIAAETLNSYNYNLKSFVPFAIAVAAYYGSKKLLNTKKTEDKNMSQIVKTKERIRSLTTYIDAKLEINLGNET